MSGAANEGFEYTAPSMNGWTLRLSPCQLLIEHQKALKIQISILSGSLAGCVAAGINSMGDAATGTAGRDSTFVAAS